MKLNQILALKVFTRVVEAGSFTKAANSLDMPKATVTKLVQGLEAHLRVKLLQRTTRRVTVTPDGATYYKRASRVLADLDDIDSSMANAQTNPRGKLRIDIAGTPARLILIPALPDFCARYPEIDVSLGVSDRPADLISDSADCVIRGGELNDSSLVARRIATMRGMTCATPAYLAQHGTPQHPHDLEKGHVVVNYLAPLTGRAMPFRFARGGNKIELELRSRVAVNESNAHVAAGVAGLGLIQTPAFMAYPHVARGELVEVLREWRPPPHPIYVVYPANRHLSHRLKVFIDWVAALFAKAA